MREGYTKQNSGFLKRIRKTIERNRIGEMLVHNGKITHRQLRDALKHQKHTARPLGEILIENALITQWQLRILLARQAVLKSLATVILFSASLGSFTSKRVQAEPISGIHMVSTSTEFKRVASYPNLLGSSEKKDRNLRAFTKWTGMFARFERQLKQQRNKELIQAWQADINKLHGRSMKSMVRSVNDIVNEKQYIIDQSNWGKSDYWATPVEFLERGGDCEDFAIAKYTALRSLGFPEERLRVVIVQDTQKGIPHAVLVAYTDEGAFILDNQIKSLVNAEVKGRYRAIYSINRHAWWLHENPTKTIVASVE